MKDKNQKNKSTNYDYDDGQVHTCTDPQLLQAYLKDQERQRKEEAKAKEKEKKEQKKEERKNKFSASNIKLAISNYIKYDLSSAIFYTCVYACVVFVIYILYKFAVASI